MACLIPFYFLFIAILGQVCSSSVIGRQMHSREGPDLTKLPSFPSKPRIFVLSDILNEPDDEMSLVRFLLYSNHFDVQGICATTSASMRNDTHPEAMRKIIHAYGTVVDNLNHHVHPKSRFRRADELLSLVSSGPKVYGKEALNQPLSDGARQLIQRLEASKEPLYVGIWGGPNTLAQALQHIHKTKSASMASELRSRLRVYAISDQDDSGIWIRINWPDLFYIVTVHGFQEYSTATWSGINSLDNGAANATKVQDAWLTPNIRVGPLGAVYPLILYGMEGDSPSFMWLIQNGLSNRERPDWGGWGGRYSRIVDSEDINEYGMSHDTATGLTGTPYTSVHATVWRWRDAYQDDFAARMQWTLSKDFSKATHPPVVKVNGSEGFEALHVQLPFNTSITLDASETFDPDHPADTSQLDFEWFTYLEAGFPQGSGLSRNFVEIKPLSSVPGTNGTLTTNEAGFNQVTLGAKVQIKHLIPNLTILFEREWHVILQVRTKKGQYPIRRYKRIVIKPSN